MFYLFVYFLSSIWYAFGIVFGVEDIRKKRWINFCFYGFLGCWEDGFEVFEIVILISC